MKHKGTRLKALETSFRAIRSLVEHHMPLAQSVRDSLEDHAHRLAVLEGKATQSTNGIVADLERQLEISRAARRILEKERDAANKDRDELQRRLDAAHQIIRVREDYIAELKSNMSRQQLGM